MAIWLVEGVLGSGKTYFVVKDILDKYFDWDRENVCYKKKDVKVEIYTNIDGFFLCNDLSKYVESVGGFENFFNIEAQEKITNECKHVYVIDEVQRWFDRKYYNKKVFNFFQYSRHMGVDIYLMTQDYMSLARELQQLNEYHIKVPRRSYSMLGEFRFNYMCGYEIMRRRTVKPDLRIFKQYRSALSDTSEKPKMYAKKFMVYIALLIMGVIVCGYFFARGFGVFGGKKRPAVVSRNEALAIQQRQKIRIDYIAEDPKYYYFLDDQKQLVKKERKYIDK